MSMSRHPTHTPRGIDIGRGLLPNDACDKTWRPNGISTQESCMHGITQGPKKFGTKLTQRLTRT